MKRLLAVIASVLPLSALAATPEHCPALKDIVSEQGYVYEAPAHNGTWLGTSQTVNHSPIASFDEAIFYPENSWSSKGRLVRCSYKLENGFVIDMALLGDRDRIDELEPSGHWQYGAGPFGISVARCEGNPVNCTFHPG
jgi:uncharacterized protein DUF3757